MPPPREERQPLAAFAADASRDRRLADLLLDAFWRAPTSLRRTSFSKIFLSGPFDGRRKLIRRLGEEARDPIEELLNASAGFRNAERRRRCNAFSTGLIAVMSRSCATRARHLDSVRVMTAHAAKGLQAPVVILADATVDPTAAPRSLVKWTPEPGAAPLPIFRPRSSERGGPLDEAIMALETRELAEHWRLFYVAATRAEERLVIAGALGTRAQGVPPEASWYAAADRAFAALGVAANEGVRRFEGLTPQPPIAARKTVLPAVESVEPLPGWARAPAPVEARPSRPLSPSSLGEDAVSDPPPGPAMRAAAERGRLIHALFERLPPVAPGQRAGAADRWLAQAGGVEDPMARREIVAAVMAVLDDPAHAMLFGPDALGEAPIAATLADGMVVAGTVDRLLVSDDLVRVVDFKTGRLCPRSEQEIPPYHLAQMAAYAAALGVILPGRRIEAALLYTAGPTLFALPPVLLDAHKPRLPNAEQS